MKNILLIIGVMVLTSCNSYAISNQKEDYCVVWGKLENGFVDDMKARYGAKVSGSGGSFMFNIERVYLSFDIDRIVTVDEARIIYVNAILDLQKRINSDLQLRPDLYKYPFPIEDIGFHICYNYPDGSVPTKKEIAITCRTRSSLDFLFIDPKTGRDGIVHREPFEDAVEIVRKQGLLEHDVE